MRVFQMSDDRKVCSVRVYPSDRAGSFHGHMCSKAAKVEREGKWYCGIHDPVLLAAKATERHTKWEAEYAASRKRNDLSSAAADLLAICEIFLGGDEKFQVAVGGNPIAVDKMLSDARAVVAKAKGEA